MTKKQQQSESSKQSKVEKVDRNERRKIQRAEKAKKPQKKQQELLKSLSARADTLSPSSLKSDFSNLNSSSVIKSVQPYANEDQEMEPSLQAQLDRIEQKQLQQDGTYEVQDSVKCSSQNQAVKKGKSKFEKQEKEKEDSIIAFFRLAIQESTISNRMQSEYVDLLKTGLKSYDQDQLKKLRQVFTEDQVVKAYKHWIENRHLSPPRELDLLSISERLQLCFLFADNIDIVNNSGYQLARETFNLLSRYQEYDSPRTFTATQIEFLRNFISICVEDCEQLSKALFETFIQANLLSELITILGQKGVFTDQKDSQMTFWSFGPNNYPQTGLDKGNYRLFHALRKYYPAISIVTMQNIQQNKFLFRNEVIQMLNTCQNRLQLSLVHLLVEHTESSELIKSAIGQIVRTVQREPSMLDWCVSCENKGKININCMVELIEYLKGELPAARKDLMKGSYLDAYVQIKSLRNARGNDSVNSGVLQHYAEELIRNNPQVCANFAAMEQVSQSLSLKNRLYKHSSLQTVVSCFMMQNVSCAIKSSSGTGKTNMIFITCRELLNRNVDFAIVVANEYLYHQMYSDAILFFPDDRIQVLMVDQLDASFAKGKVLLVDEADAIIDQHKIILRSEMTSNGEIGGMVAMAQATRLVLLSATFRPHHKQFMRHVLKIEYGHQYEFKNKAQLISSMDPDQLNCKKICSPSVTSFLNFHSKTYDTIAAQKPIICFIEEEDKAIKQWLERLAARVGASFYSISTIGDAKLLREALKDSTRGIMLIESQFARGYDLKMAADGHAVVFANGTQLQPNTIRQMFGRANRSQGEPVGDLIMIDSKNVTPAEAWKKIEAREKIEMTDGYANLAALANCEVQIRNQNFKLVIEAYSDMKWQVSELVFGKQYGKLLELLRFPIVPVLKTKSYVNSQRDK